MKYKYEIKTGVHSADGGYTQSMGRPYFWEVHTKEHFWSRWSYVECGFSDTEAKAVARALDVIERTKKWHWKRKHPEPSPIKTVRSHQVK